MSNTDIMTEFAQDIYLIRNDVTSKATGDKLAALLSDTRRYINMWIDEFELEADWNVMRSNGFNLGTISSLTNRTIPITDATIRTLVASPYRPLTISQDGTIISKFYVVKPDQIGDPSNPDTNDRATVIGRNIILSRDLTDQEMGGTINADIIYFFPRVSTDYTDISVLSLITPPLLIKLGVAKTATLPNVIQGQLSPSYVQKYNDALTKAIAINNATADTDDALTEDFSFVSGVY